MANQNFKVKKGLEVGTGVTISGTDGNVHISGILTATTFAGDGSGLTGVTAEGTGVSIRDEGNPVGTAATINFIGANVTAAQSGAITNVTISAGGLSNVVEDTTPQLGGNLDLNSKSITGTGNIDITGYAAVSGVATFSQNVTFESAASFGDNDKANFGAGNDIQIYHNGTNSFIDNITGSLLIRGAGGNHVKIQSPSGEESIVAAANGSVDLYYDNSKKLETTNTGVTVTGTLAATALSGSLATTNLTGTITNAQLAGSIADGKLASTFLKNVVEDTTPQLGANLDVNSKDITGTGNISLAGVVTATSFSGSGIGLTSIPAGQLTGTVADARLSTVSSSKLSGALPALDGSALTSLTGVAAGTYGASALTPIITVDSNGRITGITTVVTSGTGSGSFNNVIEDTTPQLGGNLDLNSKTINGTGNIDITGYAAVSGVSTFSGIAGFGTHITLPDHAEIQIGGATGGDLKIYHDASHSYVSDEGTGNLKFRSNAFKFTNVAESKTSMVVTPPGAVELYYDNGKKLETSSGGVSVTGELNVTTKVAFPDSAKAIFGAGDDLEIYHDGSNSWISDEGTGSLKIRSVAGQVQILGTGSNDNMAVFTVDGASELYYDNSKKLETTNTGVTVTGTLAATAVTGDGSGLTNLPAAGISTSNTNIQASWLVTASGSSGYRFTGPGNDAGENNPDLYLVRGQRYRFTNNSGGSHPFQIRVSNGGSAYSTGVTNNGAASGNIDWNVQWDAPSKLFYQCTSHSGMVGNIYIIGGPQVISGVVTATSFSGSGAALTGVNATTLDSIDSGSFLRSDADDTFTGQLRLDKEATINTTTPGTTATYGLHFGGQSTADSATGITFSAGNATQSNANAGIYVQGSGSYGTKMYIATTDSYSSGSKTAISIDHSGNVNFVRAAPTALGNTIWHAGNDGAGSGLDADTVDGIQGASFLRSDASTTYNASGNDFNFNSDGDRTLINFNHSGTTKWRLLQNNSGNDLDFDYVAGGGTFRIDGNKVWHAGNDGAGSGLDADTLDGWNGDYYMGKSASGSYYGAATWIAFSSTHGLYWPNNYAYHVYLSNQYLLIRNSSSANGIQVMTNNTSLRGYLYADSSNNIGLLNQNGSWSLKCDSSGNVTATGNVTAYSDARIKENVRTVDDALEKVKSMRGVYFDRKDTGKASVGVIAQEVEEVLPQVVETQDTRTEENPDALEDLKTVSYGNIVGVLIEAIKDQQKQIDELKAKLEEK